MAGSDEACDCIGCATGMYVAVVGSNGCIECTAGMYVAVMGSDEASDCIGCSVGMYVAVTGSDEASDWIGCAFGRFVASTGSDQASDCTKPACPEPPTPCTVHHTARADGTSGCPAGTDIENTNAATANIPISCVECPQKQRCPGDGGSCATGATGSLCGSCKAGYFNAGPFCALCSNSKAASVLIGVAAGWLIAFVVWL